MSSSLSVMFCARPLRASFRIESPPDRFAPPQRTRRSCGIGAPPLAQLGAEFLECYIRKLTGLQRADIALLEKRLAVPSTRKLLDDPGRFAAVQVQGGIEVAVFVDRG